LLPFLYTALEEAHRTGVPVFRPLVLNYQDDPNTYNIDDQFMIGSDLLVAPVTRPDVTSRLVYLPRGVWYDYWTGKSYQGGTMYRVDAPLETVPMFVRGGAIIPHGPEMRFTGEKPVSPLYFAIYPDEKGSASTTLYEDDGLTPDYTRGVFRRTTINVARSGRRYVVNIAEPVGSYRPTTRTFQFQIKSHDPLDRTVLSFNDRGVAERMEIR
jgi:alpha-glucosidase (family GH31 glycosyl hydrolase)